MCRRGLLFAFALFLLLSISYAVPLSDCGSLSSNTYYEVTQNLNTGHPETPCLVADGVSNVAVNLKGYTVRGIEVKNSANNITIENGTIGPTGGFIYAKIKITGSSNITVKNITHYAHCVYPGCTGNEIYDSQDIYFYNVSSTMPSNMRGNNGNSFLNIRKVKNAKFEKLSYTASDDFTRCNRGEKWLAVSVDWLDPKTSTNITFENSRFTGMCDGIRSWAENLTIYNNVFDVQDVAIRIMYCNNNITNNMGKNSLYSIVYLEHNTSESYSPGTVSGLIFCNISNFQVTGPAAIYGNIQLVNSTNNTFNSFSVKDIYRAIILDGSKDNRFYNGQINNTVYGAVFYTSGGIPSTGNFFENISAFNVSDRLIASCGGGGECICNVSVRNVSLNGLPVWFNTTTSNIAVENINLNELTFCDVENSTIRYVNITNGTGFWSYSSANILIEYVNFSYAHLNNLFSYWDDNITLRHSDLSYYSNVPPGGFAHSITFYSKNITVENITSFYTNGFVFGGTNFNLFNSRIMHTISGRCYYCRSCLDVSGSNIWVENNTAISYERNDISGINLGMHPSVGGNGTVRNNTVGVPYYGITYYNHPYYFPPGSNDRVNITNNKVQNASTGLFIKSSTNITEVSFNRIENKIAPYGSSHGILSEGSSLRGENATIFNNTIYNATYGYYASRGWRDYIFNNTICNVKTVFYLYHSSEITIGNNSICDDIYTPIIIISDNSTECAHDINFTINETNPVYFSNEDDVVFENNDSIAQIFLCNVSRARVQNITMRRENAQYGIWAVLTKYSNITDFRCYNMNSDNYCLNIFNLNYENRLKDSYLANNTYAVHIYSNSNTTYIYNNTFENNTNSIYIYGYLNHIYNNTFKGAKYAGIDVNIWTPAHTNNISNNTFEEKNYYANALRIYYSYNNIFEWNRLNSTVPITFVSIYGHYQSYNNTFRFNNLTGSGAGTGFSDGGNYSFYYNNSISNLQTGIYFECPSAIVYLTHNVYHNFFYDITNYYVFWGSCHIIHLNTSVSGVAQGNYYGDILSYQIYDSDDNSYCDYGAQYPYANPPSPRLPGTPNWKDWGPIILGGIYDHPDGENESAYSALYLNKYIYDLERHYTTSLIRYNHSTQGLRLAVTGRFHWGDVNMSNASIYTGALHTGGNYTVINATSATGIENTLSFFVPNFLDKGIFVCPNAEEPSQLVYNCEGYTDFSITEARAGTTKNGITVNIITFLGREYYNITHAQKRGGAAEDIGANLTIWDTSDNETICPGDNVTFFANYSNATSGEPILNADCNISFEDGVSAMMWFNSSSLFYEYNRSFESPGIYYYNVTCNATDYPTAFEEDHAQVFICGTYLYGVNVTVINISKYNYTYEVGRYALRPGNITRLNINMNVSTEKWAGFYGNMSNGTYLVLGDATGNFMYTWPWLGEDGKARVVCTSTNGSLYFVNLTGALGSEIDTAWGFLRNAADSGENTFNQQCDITFGAYTIRNAACRPTGYGHFYTRALKIYPWLGHKDQMVFCTNITSATSFVDKPVDFELIVPTAYGMGSGPPYEVYYFYVAIE